MDATCAENVVLAAWEGFGVGSRSAAKHPERVSALVLYEPMVVADDDWAAWSAHRIERSKANMAGEVDILAEVAPDDRTFREWRCVPITSPLLFVPIVARSTIS